MTLSPLALQLIKHFVLKVRKGRCPETSVVWQKSIKLECCPSTKGKT